ncbi:MAG: zinc-binding dehydrogenase [Clostridium sp.]|uniref:zinc-dependent alcohol dehydrogenase n=1 Tax=Clostridium sp. TaxID=1506 RepID=UPI0025C3FF58|nr:zinc-binding dehydrogenase [Clostridium sp.]MCH3965773.1 zinc-binding dehydrogenase [Clostridium sp.]MCI1717182.1 zinc-binding dehydrogenase [Clostridium sp.]MCI1801522.1 zinc-binding dehydrogenase [Clostridium sp.]MCI1815347.1 zinc-binding dehydrogenase [Clostridium sp.]MCI1872250.1 zinc-binding dehydrogenase [Clostridium sp.]
MKALVKTSPEAQNTELRELPIPKAGYKQVVIKVMAAGICGTDIRFYKTDEGKTKLKTPVVIGHEGSGIISEIGEGVSDLKVGDHVVTETTFTHCGKCEYCIEGYYNLCINRTSLGSKVNGFFAEYVVCDSNRIHKLPDNVSFEEGAMVEPISCCVHGVFERSSIKPGDTCVVSGPGPIGIITAQLVKIAGARVILIGTAHSKKRLELAKKMGIKDILIVGQDNIGKHIYNLTDGLGADIVFECSGSNSALDTAFDIVKKLGQIVLVSAPSKATINLWDELLLKELDLISFISSKPTSWNTAIKLLQQKKLNVEDLISHKFPLNRWEEAFKLSMSKEANKIILYPNK